MQGQARVVVITNRVDIYQPDTEKLAIPAGGAFVFIEGRLYPYLEVVEIIQAGKAEYGSARMRYNTAADSDGQRLSVEEVKSEIGIGKPIVIKWLYNNLYPAGGAEWIVIFAGQVERFETTLESVDVIASDFSAVMERVTVLGRWARDIDGRLVFIDGIKTVFNEAGQPNATAELNEHRGSTIRLFAGGNSGVRFWDCADVIRYLLCEYVPAGGLVLPDEQRLRAIAADESVRDLDVSGLSLLEALGRCCEQAGLEFKFVPRLCECGPQQAIVFYRNGQGRQVELNLQKTGERLGVSKTNVWKAVSKGSFWPVTHRWRCQGDYKVFEATFELVKGWPWYDEDVDYERFSPSTNPEFYKVKDTWRKWCLNEAGDYTDEPFTQGPAYDFTYIFGTDKFVHRRRRFWPALSCDAAGKSLGYLLEVSYDAGEHWWQYPYAFDNLLDECGIWLASDRLDINTWIAAIKGVLRFRLTASVVSDERLSGAVANGPAGSATPVVEHIIEAAGKFKFRKVTGKSIFAGGEANETDDTAALYQFVRRHAQAQSAVIETFNVQTPYLGLGFEVGDIVKTNHEARDIFSLRSDNRSTAIIEKVRMDFEKQTTEMKVVRTRGN